MPLVDNYKMTDADWNEYFECRKKYDIEMTKEQQEAIFRDAIDLRKAGKIHRSPADQGTRAVRCGAASGDRLLQRGGELFPCPFRQRAGKQAIYVV